MKKIFLVIIEFFIFLMTPFFVHATCPGWVSSKLMDNGSDSERYNVVIMGDGFDSSHQTDFDTVASNLATNLFGIDFYNDYKSVFNVYKVNVISTDNCVDNPNNTTPTCDTALDTTYNTGGTQRCVLPGDTTAVNDAADCATTNWDVVVVIANDPEWGGCASGNISAVGNYTGTSGTIQDVTAHEFGHAIGSLSDEYDYASGAYSGTEPTGPNCTINTSSTIKWSSYLTTTTLPTPETSTYDLDIGAFEGCGTYDTGIYRPSQHCKMLDGSEEFCDICYDEMVTAIYPYMDNDNDGLNNQHEEDAGTDPNDADTDDDGLNDGDEVNVYETDPLSSDTDSDGLTDKEEVDHLACLDPNNSSDGGNDGDADEEGLVNGDEIRTYGTNPCSSDTDSDVLTDKEEVDYLECLDPLDSTDPKNASGDADEDSLTNLEEIRTCFTNPCETDTDNDGLSDRDELLFYDTDPTDKDTDNDGWSDKDEVDVDGKDPLSFDNLVSLSNENDFNGDGLSDLLAFGDEGNYCVMTSTGAQFSHQGQWIENLGDITSLPITGDFNGDGLTDVSSLNADGTLSVGLSDGAKFVSDSAWSVSGLSLSGDLQTLTGDFNGDGKSDFIIYSSDTIEVFVLSSKTFTLEKTFNIDFDAVTSADFNGDGSDDLAFLSEGNVSVALATGTGFDAEEEWLTSFYDAATQVFAGDFDADGLEDIWVYDASDQTIKVALSLGDAFRDVGSKLTSSFTDDLEQIAGGGDFDGDGHPDLFGIYEDIRGWRSLDGDVFLGSGFFFNLDGTWKIRGLKNIMKCQGVNMPIKTPSFNGMITEMHLFP